LTKELELGADEEEVVWLTLLEGPLEDEFERPK
jgi:hypothetical protein